MKTEIWQAYAPDGQRVNITCPKAELDDWLARGYQLINAPAPEEDTGDAGSTADGSESG